MATAGTATSQEYTSTYAPETHGGTVTSWVPLTTSFSVPEGCETSYWSVVANTLAAWDPGMGISADLDLRCQPAAATQWWDQDRLGKNSLTQMSIGPITCPSGYSTATTRVDDQTSTFVACCPPDYTFISSANWGDTGQCSSVISKGQSASYWIRNSAQSWVIATTTYTAATKAWGVPINGYNVGQKALIPAQITSSTLSTSTRSPTSSSSSPATATPPITKETTSSELSTGAKAGIGAGAALLALALIGAIVFIFMKRRRARVGTVHEAGYVEPKNYNYAPGAPSAPIAPPTIGEMEANTVYELPENGVHSHREYYKPTRKSSSVVHTRPDEKLGGMI